MSQALAAWLAPLVHLGWGGNKPDWLGPVISSQSPVGATGFLPTSQVMLLRPQLQMNKGPGLQVRDVLWILQPNCCHCTQSDEPQTSLRSPGRGCSDNLHSVLHAAEQGWAIAQL